MNSVHVGLLGLGTVGGGTVQVLAQNAEEIERRCGREIRIEVACAREIDPNVMDALDGVAVTEQPDEVVTRPDVDVVIELFGGLEPARTLVLEAIAHRKHVVTANKALIAHHGNEIFAAARANGVVVAFEAAVGGGIPIIKAIREGLAANRIQWLTGIINGTGNFILSEMRERGRTFDNALAEAQSLGYAEADPTFDVEGIDAAHKLCILASIAFGLPLRFEEVYTEGIAGITPADVGYAEQLGYRIKHLGVAKRLDAGIELRVHPTLVPARRLIANVDGVMNAVLVKGDAVGSTLYYGPGAGSAPTASAVVADLIDCARALAVSPDDRVPPLAFQPDGIMDFPLLPMGQVETAHYLRIQAADRPGVLAKVANIFGERNISIEAVLQKEPPPGIQVVPLILLTHRAPEGQMVDAIGEIEALENTRESVVRIRVEQLGDD